MKRFKALSIGFGLAALLTASTASAQILISNTEATKLYITLNTVGTAQTLHQENVFDTKGAKIADIQSGMQTAFGDLGFIGKFGKNEEIEMYFDLYLASRNHPSTTYGDQGYLIFHGVPENLGNPKFLKTIFDHVDVKVGAFVLDYGDQQLHRTNNAISQNNRLVGNYIIDPNFVSVGGEVMSKPGKFNWLVGVTNGTNTEDFQQGRGNAFNAKVWLVPIDPVRLSASAYTVDHSDTPVTGGSRSTLFSGNRSGERYAAVLGGGQAPGQILPSAGKKVRSWQLDAAFEGTSPLKFYANYGNTKDEDTNGSAVGKPVEQWKYYSAEGAWYLTPNLYGAARYNVADAVKFNNLSSNGKVKRIQIGGGLWLTKHLLAKVEYVDQKYSGFAVGNVVNNGIAAWKNPEFKGFVSEVSFAF